MNNVSLLPPEIRAGQRSRRQMRLYLLCSGLVVLVFLCIYGGLFYMTYLEKEDVVRLQEQKNEVTRKAAAYKKYGDLKAKVDALESMNAAATSGTTNWYYILAEVGSHLPDRVWLTDYTAVIKLAEGQQAQAKESNAETEKDESKSKQTQTAAVSASGELTIRGKAFSHNDAAAFLEKLHDVQGLDNVLYQFSSEEELNDQKIYEFEIKASLPVQKGGK